MDIRFDGKVVLVTGGASGIGRATALAFARSGARVVVGDVDAAGAEATLREIGAAGVDSHFVRTDVSKEHECARLVSDAVARFGRLDIAFNNAGIVTAFGKKLHESTEQEWDRLMDVNLKGVFLCMKHEITQMLGQGGGAIVNTASTVGLIGNPKTVIYPASKHGVVGLTRSAALQYAGSGIRINAVCPGLTETPITQAMRAQEQGFDEARKRMVPMGRIAAPEEIASAVLWLSCDAASYVTGTSMLVDGGWVSQ